MNILESIRRFFFPKRRKRTADRSAEGRNDIAIHHSDVDRINEELENITKQIETLQCSTSYEKPLKQIRNEETVRPPQQLLLSDVARTGAGGGRGRGKGKGAGGKSKRRKRFSRKQRNGSSVHVL